MHCVRSLLTGKTAMLNDTPLLENGRKVQLGCFAHIPGTGPAGEICARCSYLTPEGPKFVCIKYRLMSRQQGKPISPNSSACRYFSPRKRFNAAPEV